MMEGLPSLEHHTHFKAFLFLDLKDLKDGPVLSMLENTKAFAQTAPGVKLQELMSLRVGPSSSGKMLVSGSLFPEGVAKFLPSTVSEKTQSKWV